MKKAFKDYFIIACVGALLAFITYRLVMSQVDLPLADYNGHTYSYIPLFYSRKTIVSGFLAVPYFMWHFVAIFLNRVLLIPLDISAAYSACIFTLFAYGVMVWILDKAQVKNGYEINSFRDSAIAFGFCILQPLYLPWLGFNDRFAGAYSMNPIHNPTYMCMRGFALLCFCLVYDIWGAQEDVNYTGVFFKVERGIKKYYILLAVLLLLSAMAKPIFVEMFIPAVGLIMLNGLITRLIKKDPDARDYFKKLLAMFFCAIPTIIIVFLQFGMYFLLGGSYGNAEGTVIITKFFEVWRLYSDNIILSIVMGLAFPLFMIAVDTKFFVSDKMGKLALVGYGVGLFEAAFFAEDGKLAHGDFLWPMMSAILLLFTVSLIRLLTLERKQPKTIAQTVVIVMAWTIYVGHSLCGLFHILE